jgi:hypothetical protein
VDGSEISSTSLTASDSSPATEATLAINELGTIIATNARVEPVPVNAATVTNFRPGVKKTPRATATSTTNPTSIEIFLPD